MLGNVVKDGQMESIRVINAGGSDYTIFLSVTIVTV